MIKDSTKVRRPSFLVTGGAGFIGSNLVLELQNRYPEAEITVIDDFRSGDFKNLQNLRGKLITADVSETGTVPLSSGDCPPSVKKGDRHPLRVSQSPFSAIFHLASITDTTVTDVGKMCHDNIEGFRRVIEFARPTQTPVIYASSAATYGVRSGVMKESDPPAPANSYAFSKMILDNMARLVTRDHPGWKVVGVRYFNVFGPGEAHKGASASMIYQLARQMKAGKRPRVFKHGEQKRDFIYVKDAVDATIAAYTSKVNSGVYNVGSGIATSFNEVIDLLNRALGTSLQPEYFDCPYEFFQTHTEADLTLSKKALGWSPKFTPATAIPEYMKRLFA